VAENSILVQYFPGISLKDKQRECLDLLCEGRDCIASLPTGYGKSLIFQLSSPLIKQVRGIANATTLVICPLNIIQQDQLLRLETVGLKACRLDVQCQTDTRMCDIINGQYDLVLCHPEALFNTSAGGDLMRNETFQSNVVAVFVDECHKVDDWYVWCGINCVFSYLK
jgi:ATP-dependent DNA helicase RecQ